MADKSKVKKSAKPVAKAKKTAVVASSVIEAQKAFAEKMMAKAGTTRKEVALAMVEKFGLTESSAMSYVYRWFVGKNYKVHKTEKAVSKKPAAKAPAKKPVAKKAVAKAPAKKAPVKKVEKPVAKKAEKKPAVKKDDAFEF